MSGKIVILTGAGISAESGIATFRAADGLWENHRIEDVASPDGFARDPLLFHSFYNMRRRRLMDDDVRPNAAHIALARLQREYSGEVVIVTQNVDDLHARAGASVIHMHGELLKARCTACGDICAITNDLTLATRCASCAAIGTMRPHIVWFGEMPMQMDIITRHLRGCEIFVAIGTSGNVYPAAGFGALASAAGADTIEINLDASGVSRDFMRHIRGRASETVPRFVDEMIG